MIRSSSCSDGSGRIRHREELHESEEEQGTTGVINNHTGVKGRSQRNKRESEVNRNLQEIQTFVFGTKTFTWRGHKHLSRCGEEQNSGLWIRTIKVCSERFLLLSLDVWG